MKRGTENNPFHILLVEDNPADADLIREALDEPGHPIHQLAVATDGDEAMRFLRREGSYASAFEPDLMLLDLNLPKKDGREVLTEVRADPELTHLPVIILTSSEAERDLTFSYRLHANCFVSKPLDLDGFFAVLRALTQFWLSTAKLPPRMAGPGPLPESANAPAALE